jgi:predicted TIM-barrel fold metal-dependent hydrolase
MTDTLLAERRAANDDSWTLGRIIDADAHVEPPFEMWKDYLPARLRDLAPVLEEGDEFDCMVFEGRKSPLRQLNNAAGRSGEQFKFNVKRSEMRPVWLPETRLADMDADGIDQAVVFGGGPLGTFDNDLYLASYEAYNRWVMDWAKADRRRLNPIGYVPMRDVDETVAQVKMLAGLGFKAINIPAFPQNPDAWKTSSGIAALKEGQISALTGDARGSLQYWQPEFDKLWQAVVDNGMVLTIHLGARVPRFGDKRHFLPDMPMSKMAMAEPISIFIYNGIFERFPGLRIASVESGVGWMAWLAEYNDRTWEKQRFWTESPLKNPPSFYMDQNVYGVFLQDRIGVALRNYPGGRNIMWASDYPHSETTWPRSREVILRDCAGVPEADVRDIICNRAKDFFGFD